MTATLSVSPPPTASRQPARRAAGRGTPERGARRDRRRRAGVPSALWWHDTASISGFGDWLTNAGRITGLLAGYGVVVLVALMARLPPLERGIGADRLARWHAQGGRYTVSLVVAHGLLITWGYAVTAHTDVVSQTGTLLTSYPDVLMATVAGLLLVGVGAVSARAARRRMRYETWYYLHFYTYLAVALAFSHQFADRRGLHRPTGRPGWSGRRCTSRWPPPCSGTAACVPVRQALRHRLRVVSVVDRGAGRGVGGHRRPAPATSCAPSPASSSAGASSPASCGGRPTRTRCPPRPAATCCASPPRASASTAPRWPGCGPAPGSSPRARTAR